MHVLHIRHSVFMHTDATSAERETVSVAVPLNGTSKKKKLVVSTRQQMALLIGTCILFYFRV